MFESFVKEIKFQISERLSSPIVVSFLVAWCLWNYKFLVVLFSDTTVSQTFALIRSDEIYPSRLHQLGYWLIAPALSTILYILLYPICYWKAILYIRERESKATERLLMIDGSTPLPPEKARRLWDELHRIKREHLAELQLKDDEIEALRAQASTNAKQETEIIPLNEMLPLREEKEPEVSSIEIDHRRDEPDPYADILQSHDIDLDIPPFSRDPFGQDISSSDKKTDLSPDQKTVLEKIANDGFGSIRSLMVSLGLSRLVAEHSLDVLWDLDLLNRARDAEQGEDGYIINKAGRNYLMGGGLPRS